MKKKGFTLIELVVVVAIILLLAATLAPKLRKEVAKAKDAKAVAALGSLRTAVNIFYSDKGSAPKNLVGDDADKYVFDVSVTTSDYLERDLVAFLKSGKSTNGGVTQAPVGGYRDGEGATLIYGGYANYSFTSSDDLYVEIDGASATSGDDSDLNTYDTKDNAWASY